MNFFDVDVDDHSITFSDGNTISLPQDVQKRLNGKRGKMVLGIRGEDIKLDPQSVELYKQDKQQAVLTDTEVMGNENNLYFTFGNRMAAARVSKDEIGQIGDTITFVLLPSKMHFFDKNTGKSYTET